MKKTLLFGLAALMLCGTVNATSWRVCSKPEAGANFTSVAAAVESNSVFAGDTLYVEPGHYENHDVTITKRLVIIGPGHLLLENGLNVMNSETATFTSVTLSAKGCSYKGCKIMGRLIFADTNCIAENCFIHSEVFFSRGTGNTLSGCFLNGNINNEGSYFNSAGCSNLLIQNNIILGRVQVSRAYSSTIRSNTIIGSYNVDQYNPTFRDDYCILFAGDYCEIYNNIVINTSDFYVTTVNTDQTVDTFFSSYLSIAHNQNTIVHNNVVSGKAYGNFLNSVFNANVEDVLIWNNANTLEEKYKHIATGPAVGAGVNGTTCGAYGQVNGGRAYQPAGIPQYRPYIYDASIDETPSTNNTINASFKIKVQQ